MVFAQTACHFQGGTLDSPGLQHEGIGFVHRCQATLGVSLGPYTPTGWPQCLSISFMGATWLRSIRTIGAGVQLLQSVAVHSEGAWEREMNQRCTVRSLEGQGPPVALSAVQTFALS